MASEKRGESPADSLLVTSFALRSNGRQRIETKRGAGAFWFSSLDSALPPALSPPSRLGELAIGVP